MAGMRQAGPLAIAFMMLVLLPPAVYVASVGPAIWCRDKGIVSEDTVIAVYWPLAKALLHPTLGPPINRYCELWTKPDPPPAY
jgi:hypothetical protein